MWGKCKKKGVRWGARVDVNQELNLLLKMHKKSGGQRSGSAGGRGGCVRRIEVIVKMQKKSRGSGSGRGGLVGGRGMVGSKVGGRG